MFPTLQVDSLPAEPQGKPKNIGVGSLFLLQGIFPTQELNWCLLYCRWILSELSYQGRGGKAWKASEQQKWFRLVSGNWSLTWISGFLRSPGGWQTFLAQHISEPGAPPAARNSEVPAWRKLMAERIFSAQQGCACNRNNLTIWSGAMEKFWQMPLSTSQLDLLSTYYMPATMGTGGSFILFLFSFLTMAHLKNTFFFFFWPCHASCGILIPRPGSKLHPLQRKCGVLTTGLSGKSQVFHSWRPHAG